ncbi:nitroreductase family protein [Dysgonomonas sp. ZJ279]|uniref:nitroreductase family protein n=1 Tax=Dysgonomonas sp. ZJ279 TaxID=2709796 RepID=UPI0013EC6649|nr:nitroreductase family protein [Dysgonomonas sp. ZJ279]
MTRNFKEAIKHRRTYYSLSNKSTLTDKELKELIEFAVLNIPSSFNSQSTRIVLLLGENHAKLWNITKEILRKKVSAEAFPATKSKIDGCFAAGYGTVLYFEDQEVVEGLQKGFPSYSDKFPQWSDHTSAMHQLAIWTMLEDAGMAASLQHYNPLIDEEVAKTWKLSPKWRLIAQMPFGVPAGEPGEKEFSPLDKRVLVF